MCGLSHGKVICNMLLVFNTTVFHNISAISLWSLILMGKTTDLLKSLTKFITYCDGCVLSINRHRLDKKV